MIRALEVRLHDEPIGRMEAAGGAVHFQFDPDYWARPKRAVLGQWFEDADPTARFLGRGGRLPAFFDNLEPEGAVGGWLRTKHPHAHGPLGLLAMTGFDLPGAVTLHRIDGAADHALRVVQGEVPPTDAWSLAGVQLKLPMSLDKDDRLTLPAPGETSSWLLKIPPLLRYPGLARNEHATMTWAKLAGFDVPVTRLTPTPPAADEVGTATGVEIPRESLLIARFDRSDRGRIHQEDLCQVLDLDADLKYHPARSDTTAREDAIRTQWERATRLETIVSLAERMLGRGGAEELLRRVVLMLATGNGDMHLKNWSLLYPDGRIPAWTPLYDQVSTVAWNDERMALPAFGVFHFSGMTRDMVLRLGDAANLPRGRSSQLIDETVDHLEQRWPQLIEEAPYPPDHAARLRAHWRKHVVKKLSDIGPLA